MEHNNFSYVPARRLMITWVTCSYIAGIWIGLQCYAPNISIIGLIGYTAIFAIAAFLLLFPIHQKLKDNLTREDFVLIFLVLVSLAGGMLRVYISDRVQDRSLKALTGQNVFLTGVVTKDPSVSSTGKTKGYQIQIYTAETDTGVTKANGKIMVYVPIANQVQASRGDTVTFKATLKPPAAETYEGSFSLRDSLYRNGLCFSVYTRNFKLADTNILPKNPFYYLAGMGLTFRNSVLASVDRSFGENSEETALLKGILLGYTEDFTADQYHRFTDSGFVHIVSVSGMHVMFLLGFLTVIIRRLRLPEWLLNLLLAPMMTLLTAASAFTPSILRAVLMFGYLQLAYLVQREPDSLSAMTATALILLIVNPYYLTSYSFLLSFSATLGIVVFSAPLLRTMSLPFQKTKNSDTVKKRGKYHAMLDKGRKGLFSSLAVSFASSLGLGYFMARFFNRITWGSIIGNIPLTFLCSFAFIGGFVNWIIGLFAPAAAALIAHYPLRLSLRFINQLATFFAKPVFQFSLPTPPASSLLIYILILVFLYQTLHVLNKTESTKEEFLSPEIDPSAGVESAPDPSLALSAQKSST